MDTINSYVQFDDGIRIVRRRGEEKDDTHSLTLALLGKFDWTIVLCFLLRVFSHIDILQNDAQDH